MGLGVLLRTGTFLDLVTLTTGCFVRHHDKMDPQRRAQVGLFGKSLLISLTLLYNSHLVLDAGSHDPPW